MKSSASEPGLRRLSYFLHLYPQVAIATSFANVISCLKTLNTLSLSVQLKNGRFEFLELVALLFLKTKTYYAKSS